MPDAHPDSHRVGAMLGTVAGCYVAMADDNRRLRALLIRAHAMMATVITDDADWAAMVTELAAEIADG